MLITAWFLLRFWFKYYVVHRGNKISYLRAMGAVIGPDCDILAHVSAFGTEPYLIHLGRNVTITAGVTILTHDGSTRIFRTNDLQWKKNMGIYGSVEIGDDVFVGVHSIIFPNVKIGSRVVIGAGSVVTKNIPPDVVVAGNPARIIRNFKEYRESSFHKALAVNLQNQQTRRDDLVRYFWNNQPSKAT